MARRNTPEAILQTRQVTAQAVLDNRIDLRAYPYRHLAVVSDPGFAADPLAPVLSAVEHLSQYGWQLVTVSPSLDQRTLYAVLRRLG